MSLQGKLFRKIVQEVQIFVSGKYLNTVMEEEK